MVIDFKLNYFGLVGALFLGEFISETIYSYLDYFYTYSIFIVIIVIFGAEMSQLR